MKSIPKHLRHSQPTFPISNIVRFKMKALSIILLFLLIGCAPNTQNLIEQAHLTGDWSLVNERFEAIERREAQREAQRPLSCPRGATAVCDSSFGDRSCSCVKNSDVRRMFGSLSR